MTHHTAFLSSFRSFIQGAGKAVVFTCLFFSIWLVVALVTSADLTLRAFPARQIGGATLDAYSVDLRIALFYKAIGVLLAGFAAFTALGYFIYRRLPSLFLAEETKAVNYTSIVGILLFMCQVFEVRVSETLELIYFLHKFFLLALVLRLVFRNGSISVYRYALLLCMAFSLYFFVADCCVIAGMQQYPDLYIIAFIFAALLAIGLNAYLRSSKALNKDAVIRRLAFILLPLLLLPIVSFLKDELIFILKANHITVQQRLPIFVALLVVVALFILRRYRKALREPVGTEQAQLAKAYFPLFVFAMVCAGYYSYYTEFYEELFEMGNVYLPLMEFTKFGILPPFEKLNTHLLSDYFAAALYSSLNGLKNNEVFLYDFLLGALSFLLHYYLVYFISRNPFIALFAALFLPFAEVVLPFGFCMSVLGIFALNKVLFYGQSLKNYIRFFGILLFLMLWRIDLAYTCFVCMPLMLLVYHVSNRSRYRIRWRNLLLGFGIVAGGMLLLLLAMCAYRHTNMFSKAAYMLNYMVSSQSYGLTKVGGFETAPFKMHYFIFPLLTGAVIIFMMLRFRRLNRTRAQSLAFLSLLFISVFYLVNFNRGLTRHGLAENSDFFVCYLYLVVAATPFLFLKNQSQVTRFCAFCAIAFFSVVNWHIPTVTNLKSNFEVLEARLKAPGGTNPLEVRSRVAHIPADSGKACAPFVEYINTHLAPDETFIDFDNKPVLYFYTGRITPTWFYQNPLCLHNDFLQRTFIDDLKNYKTPYLLFPSDPTQPSSLDEVPNVVRHYRMAEYFYQNFEPYIMLGKFGLWKRHSVEAANRCDTLLQLEKTADAEITGAELPLVKGKKYLLYIATSSEKPVRVKLHAGRDTIMEALRASPDKAYLPIAPDRNFRISFDSAQPVNRLCVLQYDHMPDIYGERFFTFEFKKLPYIWGAYDKAQPSEPVLFERDLNESHAATNAFDFPESIDKSTGNTLVLTCKNEGSETKKMFLIFGNNREKGRTVIAFDILPTGRYERYAVRVSSTYKWMCSRVNTLSLWTGTPDHLTLSKVQITKGS